MSTLSHTTKVVVRKALAKLRSTDREKLNLEKADLEKGFQRIELNMIVALPNPATHIARKAGFRNRTDLEQFARKHHLL